nr:MAG TPA: hypothetical protein [Caudoviricetes sp.]
MNTIRINAFWRKTQIILLVTTFLMIKLTLLMKPTYRRWG